MSLYDKKFAGESTMGGQSRVWRWALCAMLLLATTLNYLDRQTLSILAPLLQREMRLDNEDLGWLFFAFYYSYTFSQFAVGPLLDRYNLRWCYGLAVVLWSLVAGATGLAGGFASLIAFRTLLGVAESANWPGALRIVSRALPPKERAMGSGVFTSGTSIGALVAPVIVLGLSSVVGWRWSFAAVGSFGFVWFAAWWLVTRGEERSGIWRSAPEEKGGTIIEAGKALFYNPRFWQVWVVAILINPCLYFSVNWLPTYFAQQRGLSLGSRMGVFLTAIYIGLDLGYLACGASVMWLTRRGHSVQRAQRVIFLWATALITPCAVVSQIENLQLAVIALTVVNLGIGLWIANYLTMVQGVSREHVSTAAGLLGGSGSLVGALAMWAVGRITRQTASFAIPMASVVAAAIIASMAGWAVTREPVATAPEEVMHGHS